MTLAEARASGKWHKRPSHKYWMNGSETRCDGQNACNMEYFGLTPSDLDATDYILEEPVKKKVKVYRPIFKFRHSGNYDLYTIDEQWSPYKGHWDQFSSASNIVDWDEREIEVKE